MRIVVEHLEECLSPWIMSEYRYVVRLFGGAVAFTNVRSPQAQGALKKLGVEVFEESVADLLARGYLRLPIVLDPSARESLKPEDLESSDSVVLGGIMGEHPPRGRTFREITSRLLPRALPRNLGRSQLTIAGAAYVLKRIASGSRLEDLDIRFGLRFSLRLGSYMLSIELPYAFPYENGKPVLPEGYLEVIARRSLHFESRPSCVED